MYIYIYICIVYTCISCCNFVALEKEEMLLLKHEAPEVLRRSQHENECSFGGYKEYPCIPMYSLSSQTHV